MRTLYLFIILFMALPFAKVEARDVTSHTLDSLYAELKEAAYPADSVMVLYNIFDASTREQQKKMAKMFYNIASRTHDVKLQLDLLRNYGNIYLGNDSIQRRILEEVEKLPPSAEQQESAMFIRLLLVSTNSLMKTAEQKQKYVSEALEKFKNRDKDMSVLDQLELLYTLCVYLDATVQGDLLEKYMQEGEKKIDELPFGLYAFRNMFYAHSALMYSRNQKYEKAVNADKKLLAIIDSLEADYKSKGRVFKDFDRNRYICYRRMLYNYPALTPGEVENAKEQVWNLVEKNKELRADFNRMPLAEIFYHMARKDYANAKPMLVKVLGDNLGGNEYLRPRLNEMLCVAAEATGDKELYTKALKDYVDNLKKLMETKSRDRYRELQVIYDVDNLTRENARLEEVSAENETKHQRFMYVCVCIIGIILLIGVLVMSRLYIRARRLSKRLKKKNRELENERVALTQSEQQLIEARDKASSAAKMKSDFIDNMTHEVLEPLNAITAYTQLIIDSLGPDWQKRLGKFVHIVERNCDVLNTVVTDAISMSTLSKDELRIVRQKVSLHEMCNDAISSIEVYNKECVQLINLAETRPDMVVNTDPMRVQQVLTNLLNNGLKFTEEGSVTLDYSVDENTDMILFSVTDTGCGIVEEKENAIFERFEKADPHSAGLGLGLTIAKQIAHLLGGDVVLDTAYHSGARFIFSIPM